MSDVQKRRDELALKEAEKWADKIMEEAGDLELKKTPVPPALAGVIRQVVSVADTKIKELEKSEIRVSVLRDAMIEAMTQMDSHSMWLKMRQVLLDLDLSQSPEKVRLSKAPTDEDQRAYWLRQKLDESIRQLRDIEDWCRPRNNPFDQAVADRVRRIYEQITDSVINGKLSDEDETKAVRESNLRLADLITKIERIASSKLRDKEARKAILEMTAGATSTAYKAISAAALAAQDAGTGTQEAKVNHPVCPECGHWAKLHGVPGGDGCALGDCNCPRTWVEAGGSPTKAYYSTLDKAQGTGPKEGV